MKKGLVHLIYLFGALCFLTIIHMTENNISLEPKYKPFTQVYNTTPTTTADIRLTPSTPALLDVSEDKMYAKYFDSFRLKYNLSSVNQNQLKAHIRRHISNTKHLVLWFNGPDYFSLSKINTQLQHCLYNNCVCTDDRRLIRMSSAVIFCTTCERMGPGPPSEVTVRPSNQVWIFQTTEPPHNHLYQDDFRHHLWKDTMNWSMTYRLDSDIVQPYAHLVTRSFVPDRNYSEIFRGKTKFAAWFVSHCAASSLRDSFVSNLRGYGLQIDVFGKCGVPLKRENEEEIINKEYKFYLSLENSLCKDYITEKFFSHFHQDTILVVRGGADYAKLLPSDSFIDASSFKQMKDLVDYLLLVNSSEEIYTSYLKKKDRFVQRENNLPYCNLCAKLNNKDENRRVYHDIVEFIYTDQCHRPTDVTNTVVLSIMLLMLFFVYAIFLAFKGLNRTSSIH